MHKFFFEQRKAFSFRKLTIGLVSLCVGTSLLFGIQSQEVSASTVSPSQIRFEYVLEAELSAEERQLIQSSLPAELKEEATYFVVYRPSKKVLPATGELAGSGLAVLGLGFLVLAVSATKSKKARVLTMLYVTTSGLALPVLEVGAVQSSALAAYNQTITIRPGDSLPDGKLRLDGYEFVGYFIEEKSEVKSQARDEKTSLSTSNQLEESKTSPETAEVDKQISTGEVSGKPDQASQPIVEQADKADKAEETGQTEQADKTEQTGKAEESQDQADLPTESPVEETSPRPEVEKEVSATESTGTVPAQPTEESVEEKLITTIPTEAPSHLLPTIDFQVQDKVEEIALEIPEEQIETNQLPLGQSRVEGGQAGSLRISYQEVLIDGQVIARKEISREEIPSTPRKVYIGTGQVVEGEVTETDSPEEPVQPTEAAVEEKLITTIPTEAPIHHLPTIDFQVQDKVEEIALEIPEEQIETDELAIGQSRVEEGQAGSLRISYQEVLVAGQIVARNEISREETPSIPKRTYIGTRRDEKYVAPAKLELPTATIRTQEEEISFERKEVLRPDWPLGKVEVVAGKKGKQLHTYAVIEGVETLLKTEVLEQAEAEITYKGVNRPETTTEEIVIDFTERVISDPEQYTDYRQIEVTGEQGLKRLHKENGQLVNEEIVKPAKEQVVRVGTKPIKGQVEKESLRTIEFTRRYESNDQLDYGQTRTKQPGQSGQEKVISTYQTIKGVEGQFISSRIVPVRPVQDEIIEVGTKPQIRIEQEEPVIEYVPEPAKERNVQTVLQEGHAKETTYRTVYNLDANSGQVIPIQLPGTVSHPGQVRRISVGTKPTITKKALPFTEETIPNSTLYVGERVIVRPGRAGEEITTVHYTLNPRTGETSASQPLIQVIAAVTQVVQVGTKAVDRTVETVDSRAIEFKTEYRADSTLPYPQREVLQEGSNGVERITTTRRYVRDQEVGEPTRVNEVVKVAQNRIIKVGTKPAVRRVETDFTRVYEADPNRSLNERHVKQSGIKQETTYTKIYVLNTETGAVTEQAETSQVTRSARQEIVQVGTRPVDRTERVELSPITRQNAELAKGTENVIHVGSPTIRVYRTNYSVNPTTGQITTHPEVLVSVTEGRAREVEIGTKEPEQPVTPPTENEESCPIIPDNSDGGTCEVPTEPTEKPSSPDLECILNPTDQCWPEEEEEVNQETVAQLRAKMEKLMSYRSRFRNPSWHTYIDAVYNESEKIIQSGVAADIRTQLDAIDADLEFVIDAQIPKISTDANSGASRAENIELITDANGGTAPRYEDNPTPVTPNPDQGSGTEKPVETPIPPVPPVDQEQPVPPVNPPVTPIPELEQPRPGIPDAKPVVPDTPPVAPDSQPATPVPEPEQPNISETEPVSPEKPEETTEETVEDVNKPLLRVRDNKNHYQLFTKERSTKVFYALENKQENFNKGTARLYVNKELIKTVDFTKEKLEARFGKLLPNVDYRIETEMEYRASDGTVKTAKLEDIVSVDFEERHFEIKNIDEAEVWKNENGKLVRKVALKVDPIDVQNYFIKLKSDEHKDIFLQVKDIDEIRINGERHFKLQAKFTNPEERRQKLDKYHDTVTVYLPREVRENRETRNKYSTFTSLLNAMKTNSSGTFELQQDLTASEVVLSDTDKSYLAGHFYGTLRGNGFTIHDLKVPLFDDLRGTVSDLNLKAVDIHLPKEAEVGALAKQSDNATVSNVHAQGRINAKDKIGGIIGESFKTNMKNISFRGELASVTNESNNLIGGIAGWLGGGKIEKGYVDATISSASSNVKAGGLVGQLENDNTRITSSFATGTIISTKNKDTEVGGLVGAVLQGNNIRIADSIAAVKAVNGHKVYGENQQGDTIFSNIKIVEALSTGEDNPNIGFATPEDVKAIVEDRGLIKSHSSLNVFNEKNVFDIDYTKEGFTRTDRKQAYENMEKLLPFFTRDVIIQHANRLESSDSLVTKKLVDVVLMIDKAPVFDIVQNKDRINRLLLHFEDGTVEKHYLVKKKELGSGAVVEYHLLDKNISYTPETYVRSIEYGPMVSTLVNQFTSIQFESEEVNKVLGLSAHKIEDERKMLFLKESFDTAKQNIEAHLSDLISNYNLVGLDNSAIREYLKSYISKNKVQLLLGLAYMDKWYNIQFGDVNAKNLMMKKADFFGQNVNSLDQLIRIGSMGAEMLKPKNNYALASQVIAKESIGGDLFDYLEGYRKAFAPDKTTNDWFRTTTKATIIETPSTIKEVAEKQTNPTKDIYKNGFYDKMASNHWMYKEMALILLAMPSKDIFILTDMANTLIGMYANQTGSIDNIERDLQLTAKEWAGHADYLYNILPDAHKEKMFRRVVTWDNKFTNGTWRSPTDVSPYTLRIPAMKHFYIPLGHKHDYTATGAHADYTIDNIYYFNHKAISVDGARVYTHELTHVADDDTILLGHGKRTSLDYEVYARGLFESITWDNQDRFGINNVYDFSKYDQHNYGRRLTNKTPERFQSTQDLQDYMKGYLDVIYTLDILEAEAVLSSSNSYAKQNWFNQLETQDRNSTVVKQANRTPTTLDQLIDSGMVSKRSYGLGSVTTENNYLVVNAFNPIYGSLNNDGTSRNEYEVRKIAFELLAEYGYENGMVPYLSNQYQAELGKTEENRRIRDDELISKITGSTYSNSATFRKAMFEKRKQNLEKLKSVTLVGTGIQSGEGYFYGGTRTVSASELRQLMQEAVEHDANNNKYYSSNGHDVREQSRVYSLKAAILNGYLRETNDFRESIYKDTP
ncbi:ZmpA/ZmpB/ZmpC family metallo-endopeptidase [Streptococcus suis]|uniref:ZmpA/ZmpB/ZmpC family metallo-endopeptidase n=3 Tax=Streptococcus suis TaxID=1307 RepID=UPI000414656A|nr:ZmpA/ZmpB/ZmpC family metallo-endopeptidase [Streptococcus suis]